MRVTNGLGRMGTLASVQVAMLLLAGCDCIFPGEDCEDPTPRVMNATDVPISVQLLNGAEGMTIVQIRPGDSRPLVVGSRDGCMSAPISVRDSDGDELDRRERFCASDGEWTISGR